jgi:hypothetical protein
MITLMPNKIKSYLSRTFSSSTAGAIILFLFSYGICANVTYAQIFPNNQTNTSATPTSSPPSTLQQHQQSSQPKLHLVKITSPTKGQQVPVGKDLTIFGTSLDNGTSSDCKVSVKVNGISPYHDVSGNGGPGQANYSKWNFTLTSTYTNIQPGSNKITAKFSCSNNPIFLSYNSVNVTGVAATGVAAANNNSSQLEQVSSTATPPITTANPVTGATATAATNNISSDTNFSTNKNSNNNDNNIKPLSVSVHLGKNSLHPGDKQTITLSVADKNSSAAISGASVSGKITGPSGIIKKVEGTTNDKGKASYSWKVHNDYATGKYKVKIEVSDPGYENYSGSKIFKVTPIPVTVSNDISTSNSDNSPAHIIVPSDNVDSLSTSDNANKHNHLHNHNHSTIISSFSQDTIPSNNLIPQAVSPNTNTNTETEGLHHPSTIIRSTSDNTQGNTNTNNDLQTGTSIGVKNNNRMSLNILSGSSTIAENNLGIHIDNLAQKIINDVKKKLEKKGIDIH